MRRQLIVSLADLRHVCIECPNCHTRLIPDMKRKRTFDQEQFFFTPGVCAGCKIAYDSAIQANVNQMQSAYEGLMKIADSITFLSEPEDEAQRVAQ